MLEANTQPVASTSADTGVFIDLVALFWYLRARWFWIVAAACVGAAGALLYLNFITPKYEARLRVTPATSTQGGGLSNALGRIGSLAAMAGVQVRQGSEGASPFELYLDRLRTRELAAKLSTDKRIMRTVFERQWDAESGTWSERPGPLRPLRNLLYSVSGQPIPVWSQPGAGQLQDYLGKKVSMIPPRPKDPPITTLAYRNRDPDFAIYLLEKMHEQADADVRAHSLDRAQLYAAHLADKLAKTDIAEHRINLSEALLEQERAIMMATSAGSFASVQTETATAGARPVSPVIIPSIAIGLLLGTAAGIVAATGSFLLRGRVPA